MKPKSIIFVFLSFLLINLGFSQSFGEKHILSTGGFEDLSSFCTADIDGDGDLDVIASDYEKDYSSYFENTGFGEFAFVDTIYTGGRVKILKTCDLDNDGDEDILIGSWQFPALRWKENLGDNTFSDNKLIVGSILKIYQIEMCDINGNDFLDIVYYSLIDRKIFSCINLTNGTFADPIILYENVDLALFQCIDFNLDQNIDILFIEEETAITHWLENNGNGIFENDHIIYADTAQYGASGIHAFDYDNDNDIDVVIGLVADTALLLINNGQNIFPVNQKLDINHSRCMNIISSDMDNDGDEEILYTSIFVGSGSIKVFENTDSGNFVLSPVNGDITYRASMFSIADINGDGKQDIVYGESDWFHYLSWRENDDNLLFNNRYYISSQTPDIYSISLGDFNNDDLNDIFVYRGNLNNSLLINIEDATFDNPTEFPRLPGYSPFVYDFNNDGYCDILVSDSHLYDSLLFSFSKNIGNLQFESIAVFQKNYYYDNMYMNDYDNNSETNMIGIVDGYQGYLLNFYEVSEQFNVELIDSVDLLFPSPNYNAHKILFIDVNSDNYDDMILYHSGDAKVRVFYSNNGQFNLSYDSLSDEYQYMKEIKSANINNDGYIDMVYINSYGERGWIENISGTVFIKHPLDIPGDFNHLYPIDVDNDGFDEILFSINDKLFVLDEIANNYFVSEEYNYGHITDALIFDIDYDGDLDFVSFSRINQQCAWLENKLITVSVHNDILSLLNIYPNPASSQILVSISNNAPISEITIYNQLGQKVLYRSDILNPINVSTLSDGMYVVDVVSKNFRYREKLIIRK